MPQWRVGTLSEVDFHLPPATGCATSSATGSVLKKGEFAGKLSGCSSANLEPRAGRSNLFKASNIVKSGFSLRVLADLYVADSEILVLFAACWVHPSRSSRFVQCTQSTCVSNKPCKVGSFLFLPIPSYIYKPYEVLSNNLPELSRRVAN